jgi:ATP-dependent DNA ligase
MVIDRPAVAMKRRKAVDVRPELAAEIEYRAWTQDGKLRHGPSVRLKLDYGTRSAQFD